MMPCNLVLIARHLHEDAAAQIRDERLVVRKPGNCADGLGSKPKADAHRASGKRILGEPPRQLNCTNYPRAIVVGLHRMAGMRLHEEFARFGIRSAFGMNDRAGNFESLLWIRDEFRFDDRVIFLVSWNSIERAFRQTESPITLVVFEDPWNGMWTLLIEV